MLSVAQADPEGGITQALVMRLPALAGLGLGYLHWYTIHKDRKQKNELFHEYKLTELKLKLGAKYANPTNNEAFSPADSRDTVRNPPETGKGRGDTINGTNDNVRAQG